MTTQENKNAARIAALNDAARQNLSCRVMITPGIKALAVGDQPAILKKVQAFDGFTPSNDPHHEHDFGSIEHADRKIYWKIDYYDRTLEYGGEDPADPSQTCRVMTIMLSSEY